MIRKIHNPDVLTCLANLSNDEVFTPPQLANAMLDLLPQDLFSNPNTTFLDPCCKSGVFLREIAKRLIVGLQDVIPDEQERINHIFTKQLFGISITEMTGLLSRRSVYCSKTANGKYSVCTQFSNDQGNIIYNRTSHTWKNKRCIYCGASEEEYGEAKRDDSLETHAYQFIHTKDCKEIFNMQFDVIIGNPPYQLSDGGNGASAKPIYQNFVTQAQKLNPRFLTMIIPARWYSGGKGLDEFRDSMLNDQHVRVLHDYFDSTLCFPGVDISGGVCYFLWDRDHPGKCLVTTTRKEIETSVERYLLVDKETTFIRFNESVSIVEKIKKLKENSFQDLVSARKPFGLTTTIKLNKKGNNDSVFVYAYPENGYLDKINVATGKDAVSMYKVFISKAYGERGDFPYLVVGKPFLGSPNEICSETYLMIGATADKAIAENIISYIKTKFFRFLVLLVKNTQNSSRAVYEFVPIQDFSKPWTDVELYKKYNLKQEEIDFIESMIRPME